MRRTRYRDARPAGLLTLLAGLLLGGLLVACDGDPAGPPGVASIALTPGADTIFVSQTTQLTATPLDAQGNPLTDRQVAWASSDQGVATVSQTGLVTGTGTGTATITATSEQRSATAQITVLAAGDVVITAVSPDVLVEGGTATITGSGFAPTVGGNQVTIGGDPANVLTASPTSLEITVPRACHPPGSVMVRVTVGGSSPSNDFPHQIQPATPALDLAVGEQLIITSPAEFCLQLAASGESESYVFGVQSASSSAGSLTPVRVRGRVGDGGTATSAASRFQLTDPSLAASPGPAGPAHPAGLAPDQAPDMRMARHRAAERLLRERERALVTRLAAAGDFLGGRGEDSESAGGGDVAAASIPSNLTVGQVITIRVPDVNAQDLCAGFNQIDAIVRVIGGRGIWLEDTANPSGGFTTSHFQALSDIFDDHIYATDVAYFGQPTDVDDNGRIAIVTTKEVNKMEGLLGFVFSGDLFAREQCASSDHGEVYYGRAPDPNGAFGPSYAREDARKDATNLIAHEFAHIIQFGRRIFQQRPLMTRWEMEGQAVLAEEVVGYAINGRQPGQNYGFDVAFNDPPSSDVAWHRPAFTDIAIYFGFRNSTSKVEGAPEQCTWLDSPNDGPCIGNRHVYGVPWSLLRWISDHFGPSFSGGEQALQRALVNGPETGFANLSTVTGEPIETLLAQWGAMLYTDERVPPSASRLTLPSWDLRDIEDNLVEPAQLQPRVRGFTAFTSDVSVRGGSSAYYLLQGGVRPATAVRARTQAEAQLPGFMQMWVVRLQ